jgi:cytochrome P450
MTTPTTTESGRASDLIAEIFAGKPEDPSPLYDEAREIGDGVHFFAPANAFFAFRYDDVQTIAVDPNFSSDFVDQWPIARDPQNSDDIRFVEFARRFMAFNDPPRHTALRGIFRKAFMPNAIARWRPTVERAVDGLLDRFTSGDQVEFVSQLSADVPVEVICAVLGIDELDKEMIRAGTHGLSEAFDPNILVAARSSAIRESLHMADEVDAVIDRRRAKPAGDLISLVLEAQAEGGADVDAADLLTQVVFLLAAGNHTTINMLSNGVRHLLQHPDQRALLQGDPGLVSDFINESLRMEPPIHITPPRLLKEAAVLGTTALPAGSLVFQVLASANRDPRKFDNPGEFRIDRRRGRHVTFNHGIHSCVGAPLARLEAEVFFTRLLAHFPDFAAGAAPVRLPSGQVQVRGVETLPIRL